MDVTEIFKPLVIGIVLLTLILFFNFLLKNWVTNCYKRKLSFASGVFVLFSILIVFQGYLLNILAIPGLQYATAIVIQCCWWFSLNLFINQLLDYFIWNKLFMMRGIAIPKIFKDLISLFLIILTVAAVVHFVFSSSVLGIFTASGVMAIILGYSAQATLSDVFAGLGLNTSKQFKEGDWIRVMSGPSSPEGKVVEINWRFVNLISHEGNYVSFPNSVISKLPITNLSQPNPISGMMTEIKTGIEASPNQVKNILLTAVSQSSKVLSDPPPACYVIEFLPTTTSYQLVYYTREVNPMLVKDEILSIIWYQCRRAGISLVSRPIPEVTTISPMHLKSFLRKMDIFSALNWTELQFLVDNCTYRAYGAPEQILAQGQANQSLYLIYQGGVDVYLTVDTKQTRVASFSAGNYFGEMSLLTGDPCSASIVVNQECTIIEIGHDNMATLFAKRPELMDQMSEAVVLRQQHNLSVTASLTEIKNERNTLISRLSNRVKNFFHGAEKSTAPSPPNPSNDSSTDVPLQEDHSESN